METMLCVRTMSLKFPEVALFAANIRRPARRRAV